MDGLHRATLSSNILNEISLKGADQELDNMVESFWQSLHPGKNGKLVIGNKSMETSMILDCIAPGEINSEFCSSMIEYQRLPRMIMVSIWTIPS